MAKFIYPVGYKEDGEHYRKLKERAAMREMSVGGYMRQLVHAGLDDNQEKLLDALTWIANKVDKIEKEVTELRGDITNDIQILADNVKDLERKLPGGLKR